MHRFAIQLCDFSRNSTSNFENDSFEEQNINES